MTIDIPISKSWKTSMGGIASLLASLSSAAHLLHQGNFNFGDPNWTAAIAGIAAGISLLFARDHNVSSEQAGIKAPAPEKPTVIVEGLKPQ